MTRPPHAWTGGSPQASEQLHALIYDDLRRIAREYMRRAKNRINDSFVFSVDPCGL